MSFDIVPKYRLKQEKESDLIRAADNIPSYFPDTTPFESQRGQQMLHMVQENRHIWSPFRILSFDSIVSFLL